MAALLGGCIQDTPDEGRSLVEVGEQLPEVSVMMADGSVMSTADLRGQRALTVLFTTGCGDCRALLPVLEELHRRKPEVPLLLIARNQSAEVLAEYWEVKGLTMPYSPQEDNTVYLKFATSGVPRVYATDENGIITAAWDYSLLPTLEDLMQVLEIS